MGEKTKSAVTVIQERELAERGMGGIYGVGKAAVHKPALAVLSHVVEGATETVAWVGKGIVYDTGGLSIKVASLVISNANLSLLISLHNAQSDNYRLKMKILHCLFRAKLPCRG